MTQSSAEVEPAVARRGRPPSTSRRELQRVIRATQQVRGECATQQVPDVEIALASGGGAGALFNDVMLLGAATP